MVWIILLWFGLINDPCPLPNNDKIKEINCELKQESHGWKLWLVLRYRDGKEWRVLEKPSDREFWLTDEDAFKRCSEWRKCVSEKIKKGEKGEE